MPEIDDGYVQKLESNFLKPVCSMVKLEMEIVLEKLSMLRILVFLATSRLARFECHQ